MESIPSAGVLRCSLCPDGVFSIREQYRLHYKSEWHSYNLRRKQSEKTPVSESEYEMSKHVLDVGRDLFVLQRKSNKKQVSHEERLRRKEEALTKQLSKEDAPATCYNDETLSFMDDHQSVTIEDNLTYMQTQCGLKFFNESFCCDLKNLVIELGKYVYEERCCLQCRAHFRSTRSVQDHMRSLGHTVVSDKLQSYLEENYFDFSSSYEQIMVSQYQFNVIKKWLTRKMKQLEKPVKESLSVIEETDEIVSECHSDWEDESEEEPQESFLGSGSDDDEVEASTTTQVPLGSEVVGMIRDLHMSWKEVRAAVRLEQVRLTEYGTVITESGTEIVSRNFVNVWKQRPGALSDAVTDNMRVSTRLAVTNAGEEIAVGEESDDVVALVKNWSSKMVEMGRSRRNPSQSMWGTTTTLSLPIAQLKALRKQETKTTEQYSRNVTKVGRASFRTLRAAGFDNGYDCIGH